MGSDRGPGRAGGAHGTRPYQQYIQQDVENRGGTHEKERRFGIAQALQNGADCVVAKDEYGSPADDLHIAAGVRIGLRRNIQRPEQRLIDGKAEHGNHNGGRQRQEKQHSDGVTLSLLVARPLVLGNQNAPAHGQADTEGIDDKAQHGGIADGGQADLAHNFPHHQHIHHIVEGLQQVGQKQREGELNQFFRHAPGQ